MNRQSTSTTPVFSSSESTTTSETTSTEYINTTKLSEVQEIFSTEKISSSTSESVEEPTSSPSSSTVLTSSTTSSTEEPTVQTTKSPIISEPRPFSVEQKSTISTTYKPVVTKIRSTTSPTKVSDTSVRSRFRRPYTIRNTENNNIDGVSDNSLELGNSSEKTDVNRYPSRSKNRFSRPDNNEDTTISSKPIFRQRKRPVFTTSTQKTLNDKEEDEIQRKYRPLSLDDLSSLTAADITIQKGSREGAPRRTRIRTTTTESPEEEITTSKKKSFERNRIPSTGRSTTPKTNVNEEQNEVRIRNSPSTSESPSITESPKKIVITTRRRIFNRTRISSTEKSSNEIENDSNDQIKSGSVDIQLRKEEQKEFEPTSTENIRRPSIRMRKVLRRLRTSTLPPSTASITDRGKPLSYASLNLEAVTSSDTSSSESTILVIDSDSNESGISDEAAEEDENIKLSATNIRENSDISNNNAIQDISFQKFKKADVVFDKSRYGIKFDEVSPTSTPKPTTIDSFSPRTRKFIRRLRPTANDFEKESSSTSPVKESEQETKISQSGRGRKIVRRLRPTSKSNYLNNNGIKEESFIKKNQVPQFVEKRRQYPNRDGTNILKNSSFKRKFTTPKDDLIATSDISFKFGNVENEFSETTTSPKHKFEATSLRGSLKYIDIVRSTTLSDKEDQTQRNVDNEEYGAFYFTTPHSSTLNEASEETSFTLPPEESTPLPENESNEIVATTTLESMEKSIETSSRTYNLETVSETQQGSETTDIISLISTTQDYTSPLEELSTSNSVDYETNSTTSNQTEYTDTLTTSVENTSDSIDDNDLTTIYYETTTPTTTTEYIRKSTLRSLRLRPTYQIRRLPTSTTTGAPKDIAVSEKTQKLYTRKKPSFRQKSTTESNIPRKNSSEKPRRRYPFSKFGRFSTTTSSDKDHLETTEKSSQTETKYSSPDAETEIANSNEKTFSGRQQLTTDPIKSTTEVYQKSTESTINSESAERQRLRNKSLFSKKRKMNIPIHSSSEVKEESTTEHYTTLYHVFAEPENKEKEADIVQNETHINTGGRIEPLVEINRIIEVHIGNSNSSSELNGEARSIFDKIGAINRVTSIKVVDANGTKIADLPLDQTSQRLTAVHDIIEQEKKNEAISEHRKDRKFDLDVQNNSNNGLNNIQRPEIIDGNSHIKVITPKPVLTPEVSTIALEALFSSTEKPRTSQDNNATTVPENELLDTEFSRFVNIRIIKPVDGRSIDDSTLADTPMVVKVLPSDDEVTMKAKVVEVTPKNLDQTIRIAPIQVAMARTIADTPVVGISRLNEKISNTPFRLDPVI